MELAEQQEERFIYLDTEYSVTKEWEERRWFTIVTETRVVSGDEWWTEHNEFYGYAAIVVRDEKFRCHPGKWK